MSNATSGSNPASGPIPNTVCVNAHFFGSALDMLAYSELTQFRHGTCLLLDPAPARLVAVAVCTHRHVHLRIGPEVSVGELSPISVSAYALALSYDREAWGAGLVPDIERSKQALRDCIAVIRGHSSDEYADWLTKPAAKMLSGWVKGAAAASAALQPTTDCEAQA